MDMKRKAENMALVSIHSKKMRNDLSIMGAKKHNSITIHSKSVSIIFIFFFCRKF